LSLPKIGERLEDLRPAIECHAVPELPPAQ
jgi:hypothetical protein